VVACKAGMDLVKGRAWPDTEEVTGSNPVAPTTPLLSRASADRFVLPMDGDRDREVADGRESVSLFNQGVHLGSQLSAGPHTSPDVLGAVRLLRRD